MKALKSIVLLTAGVLALSACDKRNDTRDTTMGAGAAGTELNAEPLPAASDVNTNTVQDTDQGSGAGAVGGAAVIDDSGDTSTSEGSGAVSDDAASEDLNAADDEAFSEDTEIQEEESYNEAVGTDAGTGATDSEYIDESSSEPNDVRGGRDARLVPRNNQIDNTSSEPDQQDL